MKQYDRHYSCSILTGCCHVNHDPERWWFNFARGVGEGKWNDDHPFWVPACWWERSCPWRWGATCCDDSTHHRASLSRDPSSSCAPHRVATIIVWWRNYNSGRGFWESHSVFWFWGELLVEALNTRDLPITMGCVLVIAALFVVLTTLVDVLYAVLDPRIRAEFF